MGFFDSLFGGGDQTSTTTAEPYGPVKQFLTKGFGNFDPATGLYQTDNGQQLGVVPLASNYFTNYSEVSPEVQALIDQYKPQLQGRMDQIGTLTDDFYQNFMSGAYNSNMGKVTPEDVTFEDVPIALAGSPDKLVSPEITPELMQYFMAEAVLPEYKPMQANLMAAPEYVKPTFAEFKPMEAASMAAASVGANKANTKDVVASRAEDVTYDPTLLGNPYLMQAAQGRAAQGTAAQGTAAQLDNPYLIGAEQATLDKYIPQGITRGRKKPKPVTQEQWMMNQYNSLSNSQPLYNEWLDKAAAANASKANTAFNDMMSAFNSQIMPGMAADAFASGQYGSSRAGVQQGLASDSLTKNARTLAQGVADANAGLYNNAYSDYLGAFNSNQALKGSLFNNLSGQMFDLSKFNTGLRNDANIYNANTLNDFSKTNADLAQQMGLANLSNAQQMALQNLGNNQQMNLANLGYLQDSNIRNNDYLNQFAKYNTDAINAANQYNSTNKQITARDYANALNNIGIFNAESFNRAESDYASALNEASKLNAGYTQESNKFNADQMASANAKNADIQAMINQYNADQANNASLTNANAYNNYLKTNTDILNQVEQGNVENFTDLSKTISNLLTGLNTFNVNNLMKTDEGNVDILNKAALDNVTNKIDEQQFNIGNQIDLSKFNTDTINKGLQYNASGDLTADTTNAANDLTGDTTNANLELEQKSLNLDSDIKAMQAIKETYGLDDQTMSYLMTLSDADRVAFLDALKAYAGIAIPTGSLGGKTTQSIPVYNDTFGQMLGLGMLGYGVLK